MKRFIVISLLVAFAADLMACYTLPTHNYYLFSTVESGDWSVNANMRTLDNWRAYAENEDIGWFNADEMTEIARKKGDQLMVSYINHLQRYLDVSDAVSNDRWDYPTKQDLQKRRTTLMAVQQYAFSKIRSRLRSQHALLYMRCNMLLGQHQKNVQFWETTAQKFINSVYRDMMRNIYAGALLKCGRADEATQIFVEQGDVASLYTYFYLKRSCQAIAEEYRRNPQSPAFTFLLQDFANNAQEAYDVQHDNDWPGKLFIRNISLQENRQMCQLCQQVVSEGKTDNPAIWQSLRAWLLYLSDQRSEALTAIRKAVELEGTPRSKDNARVLHLFISASESPMGSDYDEHLAKELTWLEQKGDSERVGKEFYETHYNRVFDRLVHQVLYPRYQAVGRPETAIAFLGAYDEQPKLFNIRQRAMVRTLEGEWNDDYSGDFFTCIDTTDVDVVERYYAFTNQAPASSLNRWLSKHIRQSDEFFHELLGTKYIRLQRWDKAISHLQKVPIDFINSMNIVPYMAQRNYHVEPWMRRQRLREDIQWNHSEHLTTNPKLTFAQELASATRRLNVLQGSSRKRLLYDMATWLAQASYAGECWYFTRYGRSIYDTARSDEANFLLKAGELLDEARQASDFKWCEKMLFAKAWLPVDTWFTTEWNDAAVDYVRVVHPESRQYQTLMELARYENANSTLTSPYVSKCDVVRIFRKGKVY